MAKKSESERRSSLPREEFISRETMMGKMERNKPSTEKPTTFIKPLGKTIFGKRTGDK